MTHKVFVGIGSNVDREKNILVALSSLENIFGELQLSAIYEATPIGIETAENYFNLVAGFESDLSPVQINKLLKIIEANSGQRRKQSCPLDIDLLLFDDLIVHDNGLDVPRKDITDYAYVAIPLAEIAGDRLHPETGESFKAISNTDNMAVQRIWHSKFQHQGEM